MLVEVGFHSLVRQVCNLLDCSGAHLLPGCPESALRHPLLDLHHIFDCHPVGSYGSADVSSLLQNERVRGLCDMAVQTEQVQSLNCTHIQCGSMLVRSVAVAPLKRPGGIFGLLVLFDSRPDAFAQGEHLLLECYLPSIVQQLEKELYCLSIPLDEAETDSINSEFLSMVMHELRTPLTAIKGYAGLLQAYRISDQPAGQELATTGATGIADMAGVIGVTDMTVARQQRYLDTIMEQIMHLEVLVSDLLDISGIHAGRLSLHCAPIDLTLLCQRVVELVQHCVDQQPGDSADTYEIRFLAGSAPACPSVWADPDRVQQVLTNLLDNAVKYSPGGGQVEVQVSALRSNDMWDRVVTPSPDLPHVDGLSQTTMMQVTVRDYGIGIPREQQRYLFKPFRRLEHPLTCDVPGAGLGLYITHKLIEAMGGQITLESHEGEGTCVMFTLPVNIGISINTEQAQRQVELVISC